MNLYKHEKWCIENEELVFKMMNFAGAYGWEGLAAGDVQHDVYYAQLPPCGGAPVRGRCVVYTCP